MNNLNSFKQAIKIASALTAISLVPSLANATDEPFQASMQLLAPIVITETNALSFADTVSGQTLAVVTGAADASAAQFTATGEPSRAVTGSVVEASIEMTTGDGVGNTKRITVDSFTTGGDMSGAGAATFDGSGDLADLRVGGTANVESDDIAGNYAGTATFRLVYN